ncbi:MAG: UDP-glucose 4-epimerase GalE [Magnetococcales bacterium]|nr:UDP-glucose 4-epimerase GalE [Magnetococcales bacterium]
MKVLVVGGAGFIGSHMLKMLHKSGIHATCLDDLSTGYREAVRYGTLVEMDLAHAAAIEKFFAENSFDVVMHFASFIQVGESVLDPAKYYQNNFINTKNLLDAMIIHNVNNFIFSSTAAIYGDPQYTPINEIHPKHPVNPYGRSKWMVEQMLEDYDRAYGLKSITLRYFNAAGADPDGELAERHIPETHLIPIILRVAAGKSPHLQIFGSDYDTPDGTCIRDYVHVEDLCSAHLLAIEKLLSEKKSRQYNLGNGQGFSVKEVVEEAGRITKRPIAVLVSARRPGDVPVLVAEASLARTELNWHPQYSSLGDMVAHAWAANKKLS